MQERLRQAELARARPTPAAEEERNRRKLTLALAAAVVTLMAVGGTGAAVYLQQRQAQAARLAVALREVELLRDQARSDPQGDPDRSGTRPPRRPAAADLLGPLVDARSRREVRDLQEEVRRAADAAEADARLLRAAVDIRSAKADDPDGSTSDAAYAAGLPRRRPGRRCPGPGGRRGADPGQAVGRGDGHGRGAGRLGEPTAARPGPGTRRHGAG